MKSTLWTPVSRRRLLSHSAGFAGAGLLLSACGSGKRDARGATVTMLLPAEPPVITAIAHTAFNTVLLSGKVNEGLLSYDFDLTPRPELATSWSVSDDGLTYRFTLRRNVLWHDGKPFTAADVAWSIDAVRQYHPRGRGTFANVEHIETPDAGTVIIHLAKPAPYLLRAFAGCETPIVPRHLYEGRDPATNPVNRAPIGTGPFKFKTWEPGSHIIFERNPLYWASSKPGVEQLVVRFIPDLAARSAAVEAGEVQLAPYSSVALSDIRRFSAMPHLGIELRGTEYNNSVSRVEFNLDRPFFQDVRVRQAFAHVIDRDVIHRTVNFGYGQVIAGPIHPNLKPFFDPSLKAPPVDLRMAENLLDAAGLRRGADGIRLRLHHDYVPSTDNYARGADYIRQALAKVGIDAQVRSQDFATYIKRVYTARDFDFTYNGMSDLFDPTVGLQRLYWSKNFKPGVPFSNGAHYSNPKIDALLEAAAVERDVEKRKDQFRQFQQIVLEDVPDITLVAAPDIGVYDKRVSGFTVGATGMSGNFAGLRFDA